MPCLERSDRVLLFGNPIMTEFRFSQSLLCGGDRRRRSDQLIARDRPSEVLLIGDFLRHGFRFQQLLRSLMFASLQAFAAGAPGRDREEREERPGEE